MATYGLLTKKADNTTVVFQNSSKSGVFARTYTCTPADATYIPANAGYRKEFPEYAGRTIRVFQLKAGNAQWTSGVTGNGMNVIDFQIFNPGSNFTDPKFIVGSTVLYVFVK
jgi:hypothetical protein